MLFENQGVFRDTSTANAQALYTFYDQNSDSAAPAQKLKHFAFRDLRLCLKGRNTRDGAYFTDTKLWFTTRLGLAAVSSQLTLKGPT